MIARCSLAIAIVPLLCCAQEQDVRWLSELPRSPADVITLDHVRKFGIVKVGYQIRHFAAASLRGSVPSSSEQVLTLSSFWSRPIVLSLQRDTSELPH
jgi:hypothetical protein